MTRTKHCADCGKPPKRPSRGLCVICYQYHRNKGSLGDYPRTLNPRPLQDTIQDYQILKARGLTRAEIAEKIGLSYPGLCGALRRAGLAVPRRKAGQP